MVGKSVIWEIVVLSPTVLVSNVGILINPYGNIAFLFIAWCYFFGDSGYSARGKIKRFPEDFGQPFIDSFDKV